MSEMSPEPPLANCMSCGHPFLLHSDRAFVPCTGHISPAEEGHRTSCGCPGYTLVSS